MIRRLIAGLGLLVAVAACGGPDVEQIQICERLIPAIERPDAAFAITGAGADPPVPHAVVVRYRLLDPADDGRPHWISCRFGGGGFERDRLQLEGVVTDRAGPLSAINVFLLRQYWLGRYESQVGARGGGSEPKASTPVRRLIYGLQLTANGIALGCLYGLLAIGYTLVYGVVGRINLAFGEIAMVGAYAAFVGVAVLALAGVSAVPLAAALILLLVIAVGAVHGLAIERLVFRPLHDRPSQAPLIASAGLAVFLQEYLRLTQGAEDRWIQPIWSEGHALLSVSGFALTVSRAQLLVVALAAALYGGLGWLIGATPFGRAVRACADDADMAALCGVDVRRTIALTFSLGAAYAAVAGLMVLFRYGGVRFTDGVLLGFKALTAALLGGIGSVPGAMLGGLVIGLLESLWAGYLTLAYKDVAIFGLLALVLIFRPEGFFGQPVRLANDAFRRRAI